METLYRGLYTLRYREYNWRLKSTNRGKYQEIQVLKCWLEEEKDLGVWLISFSLLYSIFGDVFNNNFVFFFLYYE